ncbi:transposable element Tcb2 transposase [Trichonephila clavipes]|nr:transposable element Tcb2 transposase [Trichonephila clavipes]
MSVSTSKPTEDRAGRRAAFLARWIVRSVPLEIFGSSGHEKVSTHGKPGLERPGRPRGERIEGSCGKHLWTPQVTRSTIRADGGVAIVPQTISRHLAEANLKSKCPFRALPLTPEHRQLCLQWCQARSMWNVTDWQKVVFSDESRFVLGTDDNRVRVWRHPALVVSAAIAHKIFGPTDLTSTYSVCTRRVFGGIEPRPSGLESDALTTRLPTALKTVLEAKREEFGDDALLYAKSLREELEISFEPQDLSGGSLYLVAEENGHSFTRTDITMDIPSIHTMSGTSFSKGDKNGDRFNSCQVIYSQFGLAIHQNDHQARRRFVEWAQNEIAVVPDFHKRILFSDEAHFWLNGYVNKQNCRIWSEANRQVYVETPLHPEKLTVWCALWAGGILLQKR